MGASAAGVGVAVCLLLAAAGCSNSSADAGGTGGSAGSGGAGGSAGGGAGGSAGTSATGGTAGSASGGAAGGAGVLFHDDFDVANPAWHFDTGDPTATYDLAAGGLTVKGGSLQAFGWIEPDPSWGDDVEVVARYRIETGLVGGVVVRGEPTTWDAVNCNLRDDYEQLRLAEHTARTYLTLDSAASTVDLGVDYAVRARIVGDTLDCSEAGGATVSRSSIQRTSGVIGFFVYQGSVRFDSFEVKKASN
ncbi:MAG: hypothetical protein HS104_20980 [Polyangiaceae bacterium]|nr:hypothetical protein [Polyangiaceae bacterium]MCL4749680.1 hypothetical protein [Myxococcales bacterium]